MSVKQLCNNYQENLNPVSYTHLDVYKRQSLYLVKNLPCSYIIKGFIKSNKNMNFFKSGNLVNN